MVKTCFIQVASPIHDKDLVSKVIERYNTLLGKQIDYENLGLATRKEELRTKLRDCDIILSLIVTGGSEQLIVETALAGKPVIYVAHPYMNSLPALLEAKPIAEELNNKIWAFLVKDENDANRIAKIIRGVNAALTIRGKRLGIIGGISPWLVYSIIDEVNLLKRIGIELVYIDLEEVLKEYNNIEENDSLSKQIVEKALKIEVDVSRMPRALKLYMALEKILSKYSIDVFTIKCFDIIFKLDTTACLSLSLFNDKGIVAGCEGDVPATLSMLVLHNVSGKPVFMGNPSIIDGNRMLIAHCTSPMSLGYAYALSTHFETGRGVGITVYYKEDDPVTLLRIDPKLEVFRIINGVIEKGEPTSKMHCRTQVWIKARSGLEPLITNSIGNHYVLTVGNYVEELVALAKMLGVKAEVY